MAAVRMTPPESVLIPMSQHIGAPATPVVKAGDKVLLEKKKQKVAPGEMETVLLTDKILAECAPDSVISFSLEELKK
jgi:hypothetical protein